MTKNNQAYWRKRVLYQKQQELKSAAEYELAMKSRLRDLEHEFEKEALKYTQRYANENNVSLKQAASILNSVNNHQWSMSLAEFEAKARAGGYDKVLNSEYYRSRIARLQDLHDQMAKLAEKYSATESIRMQDSLAKVYQHTYLQDFYVKDKLEGQLSVNVNHFNEQQLQDIVYQPWQGGNFSDRIWHNYTEVLPEVLTDVMLRSTVMGYSPSRVIKDFRDRFNDVSSKNVHRLVITEMGHAQEQATAKFYEDSDIEQYQYLATLESHTCDECAHLDERIFNVKDRVTGKNYPLMHPYCRCTTVPYIKGLPDIDTRWERGSNGKENWVKNMSFAKWKKAQNIKPVKRLGQLTALTTIQVVLPQAKLTDDEEKAVRDYTSPFSYVLNDDLRNNRSLSTEEQDLVQSLDSAMQKMPLYTNHQPLNRSLLFMNKQDYTEYASNVLNKGYIKQKSYFSTSKNVYDPEDDIRIIVNSSHSGRDLSKHSVIGEKEVLFPRNTLFLIDKAYLKDGKLYLEVFENGTKS